MNKLVNGLKNTLLNRNAITILGVLGGVVVLWMVYNNALSKATTPLRVPVATKDLTAGTLITSDYIEYVEVSSEFAKRNSIITSSARVLNRYVNNGTSITKGAMFYNSQVVDKEDLIERDLQTIPEGFSLYWLRVDNTSTYANSIYPGDKIDLWIKIKGSVTNGQTVYDEFIRSITVLSVKDSDGKNVFDVTGGGRTPAYLVFAIDKDMFTLLHNIEELSSMQLFPVPKNKLYTIADAKTEIVNDQVLSIIDNLVINYSEDEKK